MALKDYWIPFGYEMENDCCMLYISYNYRRNNWSLFRQEKDSQQATANVEKERKEAIETAQKEEKEKVAEEKKEREKEEKLLHQLKTTCIIRR